MRLEAIRMHAAAAIDGGIGINAMIAALPIEVGDTRPANVTVYNSMQHPFAARKTVGQGDDISYPAIAIFAQPSTVHQVMTSVRDADIPIVFAYLVKKADSVVAQQDGAYTNRAILRFLRRLCDDSTGAAFRVRNGVQLINPVGDEGIRQGETIQEWDKAVAIAATEITWRVRDTEA